MTTEIEALGGNVMCSSSRETIMYQSSVFNKDVPAVLSILADTILNPLLSPEELDVQREAAAYEIQEIWSKPEMILPELLHTTAYQGNTLGNPLLCPIESLEQMTADNLRNFMSTWYRPERIVVAGSGMPHEQLVELSEKLFGDLKPASESARLNSGSSSLSSSPSSSSSSSSSRSSSLSSLFSRSSSNFSTSSSSSATPTSAELADLVSTPSHYTGGELYIPQNDLEFTHVYVAFEGLSIHDDDIYALATLQILLGGGGSFSAGGPGKGMYSRLYTNVLNQHHSVDYCAAFHHCYSDSGLFGISASVHPSFNASIVHVIARELELCTSSIYQGSVTQAELNRAKNQLKSSLVMALESRLVEVEDLGRQIQAHGKKVSVEEMCDKIDQVDLKTLNRVATRVLRPSKAQVGTSPRGSGQATIVAQGQLEGLGDVRDLLARRGLGVSPKHTE
uniref:Alpha-MPP n=2 Tax=Kalmanozyma brasiliensis (strain GHG001) TaxID=1365824 RepID=V5EKW6_KALBG